MRSLKIIVKLSSPSQPKKMSSIRFITLLLALFLMNRLASPRTVDSGSKIECGECVSSVGIFTVIMSDGREINQS